MKKGICLIERLYVPYGQTVRFETLRVDKLIVDGSLIVKGKRSAAAKAACRSATWKWTSPACRPLHAKGV